MAVSCDIRRRHAESRAAGLVGDAAPAGAPGPDHRTWLAGFLTTATHAAQRAGQELTRLQGAAAQATAMRRTARSQLPAAAALALSVNPR
jgi:hypothetical protein